MLPPASHLTESIPTSLTSLIPVSYLKYSLHISQTSSFHTRVTSIVTFLYFSHTFLHFTSFQNSLSFAYKFSYDFNLHLHLLFFTTIIFLFFSQRSYIFLTFFERLSFLPLFSLLKMFLIFYLPCCSSFHTVSSCFHIYICNSQCNAFSSCLHIISIQF